MKVLVVASGRSANMFQDYEYKANGWIVVALNNGWRATKDQWDYWVHADDFPGPKPVPKKNQIVAGGKEYIEALNAYGGHKSCGYTMGPIAGYYALWKVKPKVIGYLGADMNYTPDENGSTHFYGVGYDIKRNGVADPDRMAKIHGRKMGMTPDRYIHHIFTRLGEVARESGCAIYNLSKDPNTRLPYEQTTPEVFDGF